MEAHFSFVLCSVILVFLTGGYAQTQTAETERLHGKFVEDAKQFPSQVSIYIKSTRKHCSGTIIGPNVVVTSAFCVKSANTPQDLQVRAGSIYLSKGGELFTVERSLIYPLYLGIASQNKRGNDLNIALLFLSNNVTFSSTISAATMPEECEELPENGNITFVAWRKLEGGGSFTDLARYVDYPIIEKKACQDKYSAQEEKIMLTRNFCAGIPKENRAGCGLSGSGALYFNTLHGIYVWSEGCGSIGFPDVFISIAAYRGWIRAETRF